MERDFMGLSSKKRVAVKAEFVEGGFEDSALPQARQASLARFLEKRQERVMNASPYTASKMLANSLHPDRPDIGFSTALGASSSCFSTLKEVTSDV